MLGAALDELRSESLAILHDRLIPGTKANVDHIAVGRAGVFVIDSKRYCGRVERRSFFSRGTREHRLFVGGRDRTKLIRGMDHQVDAVRAALSNPPPLIPVLCFVDSQWGLFASPLRFGDVRVLWPRKLYKMLHAEGRLEATAIAELERQLAIALPPA